MSDGVTLDRDLLTRLARHRALGGVPPREHAWLVEHGAFLRLAAGAILAPKGKPANTLWILLSGHVAVHVDRGAGARTVIEWRAGDVAGALPYSRGVVPSGDVVAEEDTDVLAVARERLPDLIDECPAITEKLVHEMVDRSRHVTSGDLRDEKLISLGKLAAGLAHELNNPASAALRGARTLPDSLAAAAAASRRLGAVGFSDAQLAAIDAVLPPREGSPGASTLSALARADREEAIADWLARNHVDEAGAAALAGASVTVESLDTLATTVTSDTLDAALTWIAADSDVRALSGNIERAVSRIHGIVAAVKGFTYMDAAPTLGPVDIRRGIADTLTMLGAKTRAKSVEVSLHLPDDLPCAHAVGAELNQVWINLIDNALDAVAVGGRVEVTAGVKRDRALVRIIDDGPGIPREIQGRIFDPFFTTKDVGQGAGLGLDIVRRLLQRHDGEIEVDSEPGRTEFRVALPAER